jgi:hypothetical protein
MIDIPGVAAVPNGESVILSDEQEEQFKARHDGETLSAALKDSEVFETKASTMSAFDKQEEARQKEAVKDSAKAETTSGTTEGGEKT